MRRSLPFCLMMLSALGLTTCGGGGGTEEDTGNSDTDTDTIPNSPTCTADFTLSMSDGSSTTIDGCTAWSLSAEFEFDPDDPPEIRSPLLRFEATVDTGFECSVEISEPAACGEGYYRMDSTSGSVAVATWDCTGVGDAYEGDHVSSGGYVHFDLLHAGDEPGNYTGDKLLTTLGGGLSVTLGTGLTLSGDFLISEYVVAEDAEEATCAVSDGDEDDDGHVDSYFDGDDCDDGNSSIHPGADEYCDSIDHNCDGDLAEGAVDQEAYYSDRDDDGYGDPTSGNEACSQPDDTVTNDLDCDDTNPQVKPTAIEICDEIDNNCDGEIDDATCEDVDGDGYSESDGDCDDDDATIHPGAEEVCDNGMDDNCDSRTDEDCDDRDGDGYSESDGDCDDDDATTYPGAPDYCNGKDDDCNGHVDDDEPCEGDTGL